MAADLGSSLAAAPAVGVAWSTAPSTAAGPALLDAISDGAEAPVLLIGDLLVGPSGFLAPSAPTQFAIITGLMQRVYADLMEVYSYYALLGSAKVVSDRCG